MGRQEKALHRQQRRQRRQQQQRTTWTIIIPRQDLKDPRAKNMCRLTRILSYLLAQLIEKSSDFPYRC